MNYMGSRRKAAPVIVPIINKYITLNKITKIYDCCCGGAYMTDKFFCDDITAIDLSPSLISLHQQAQSDFSKIPLEGSREYWDKAYSEWKKYVKKSNYQLQMPLYEIGAIEWYSSQARGGFPRGYAKSTEKRDYFKEGRKAHHEQSLSPKYKKIKFVCDDYKNIDIPHDALIYIDPPHYGVKPYGISLNFNYKTLYEWLKEKSQTNKIYISEKYLPEEFDKFIIWQDTNEKLWFIDKPL